MGMRRLVAGLAAFALVFGVAGCDSKQAAEERELRELEAKVPSYYLTADDIGEGYKFDNVYLPSFDALNCAERELPDPRLLRDDMRYATYVEANSKRSVTVSATISDWKYHEDFPADISRDFEDRCRERWHGTEGETDWKVWQSHRLEGFSDNVFAYKATQWEGLGHDIAYPPTQHDLDTNETLILASSVQACGRIGDYLVTVHISDLSLPPSAEEDLKRLWDLQVQKVLTHIEETK